PEPPAADGTGLQVGLDGRRQVGRVAVELALEVVQGWGAGGRGREGVGGHGTVGGKAGGRGAGAPHPHVAVPLRPAPAPASPPIWGATGRGRRRAWSSSSRARCSQVLTVPTGRPSAAAIAS